MDRGVEESPPLGRRVGVDAEALAVDRNLVVEPAHRRQIPRIGTAAVGPSGDVMHLQAIPAGTARNRACRTITIKDEAAQPRRDSSGAASHGEWCPVRCSGGDLDHTVT
jgi:hypothetical protein